MSRVFALRYYRRGVGRTLLTKNHPSPLTCGLWAVLLSVGFQVALPISWRPRNPANISTSGLNNKGICVGFDRLVADLVEVFQDGPKWHWEAAGLLFRGWGVLLAVGV